MPGIRASGTDTCCRPLFELTLDKKTAVQDVDDGLDERRQERTAPAGESAQIRRDR